VIILSPVTILTVIPALWHCLIASGTYFLGISCTPKIATAIKCCFYKSNTPFSSLASKSSLACNFL
jgi:hypothetical protein